MKLPGVEVVWQDAKWVMARFTPAGATAVIFDDRGRLMVLDVGSGHASFQQI